MNLLPLPSLDFRVSSSFPATSPLRGEGRSSWQVPAETGRSAQADRGQRRRVLVVDDEGLIADTVTAILNKHGFDATAHYCAADALQASQERQPDILISDVIMPGCDGVELAKTMRALCPGVRILLFSGNANISDLLHDAQLEGYAFELLPKPLRPQELLRILSE